MSEKNLLIVVSGPSGSGKGTVLQKLFEMSDRYVTSVSETSRAPRPGEVNGVNYLYVTKEQFEEDIKNNIFIEYTNYCGNYYGTRRDTVLELLKDKNVILEIEVEGAMNVKKNFPEAVLIQLLPPNYKTLESRLRGRQTEKEEVILQRMEQAKKEVEFFDKYDYIIVNEDGGASDAASDIINITKSELKRTPRRLEVKEKFYE